MAIGECLFCEFYGQFDFSAEFDNFLEDFIKENWNFIPKFFQIIQISLKSINISFKRFLQTNTRLEVYKKIEINIWKN